VIAWHPDDNPTDQEISDTLDQYERLAFAGLDPDRYSWAAVEHRDGDAVHVHTLIARVDLATGKSFTPDQPGWIAEFQPLRDALNYEHGWTRPDDPERQDLVTRTHIDHFRQAEAERQGTKTDSEKRAIEEWLTQRIENGMIHDREDVKNSLAELGEITRYRSDRDYISVRPDGWSKPLRLTGPLFKRDFNAENYRPNPADTGQAAERPRANRADAERARSEYEAAVQRRAERHRRRYEIAAESRPDETTTQRNAIGAYLVASTDSRPDLHSRGLVRESSIDVDRTAATDAPQHAERAGQYVRQESQNVREGEAERETVRQTRQVADHSTVSEANYGTERNHPDAQRRAGQNEQSHEQRLEAARRTTEKARAARVWQTVRRWCGLIRTAAQSVESGVRQLQGRYDRQSQSATSPTDMHRLQASLDPRWGNHAIQQSSRHTELSAGRVSVLRSDGHEHAAAERAQDHVHDERAGRERQQRSIDRSQDDDHGFEAGM